MAKKLKDEKFSIEFQFMFGMNKLGMATIDKEGEQYKCMKKAFYAGVAQSFVLFTIDFLKLPNEEAVDLIMNIKEQLLEYWGKEKI